MAVDYRKVCLDLFGTDDVDELTKIARTCKTKNPRNAGRKKKFTSGDAKTIRRLIEDGMTVNGSGGAIPNLPAGNWEVSQ